jgi:hypothetical protein
MWAPSLSEENRFGGQVLAAQQVRVDVAIEFFVVALPATLLTHCEWRYRGSTK